MPEVILIRGVSGSGKSTYARTHYPNHVLCEADQYFMHNGEYRFDGTKLRLAHQYCQDRAWFAVDRGEDVVVANTFTRLWEMDYYLKTFDVTKVIRMTSQYGNVHGVPEDVVKAQLSRFEDMNGEERV